MSIDQKQNILTRSSEDERAHIEASLRGSIAESDEIATSNTGNGVTNSVKPTAEIDTAKPTSKSDLWEHVPVHELDG